jgi:hypothetical protein
MYAEMYIYVFMWRASYLAGFPSPQSWFDFRWGHVEFSVDKVARERGFLEPSGFLCQFSFHTLPHIYYSFYFPTLYNLVSDSVIEETT